MTEDTGTNEVNPFQKQKNKDEMKKQFVTFCLMIMFTMIAFAMVVVGTIDKIYVIPIIIIMAIVQVAFQFYYFMHMKDKGHGMVAVMLYGGVFAALLALVALGLITWW